MNPYPEQNDNYMYDWLLQLTGGDHPPWGKIGDPPYPPLKKSVEGRKNGNLELFRPENTQKFCGFLAFFQFST